MKKFLSAALAAAMLCSTVVFVHAEGAPKAFTSSAYFDPAANDGSIWRWQYMGAKSGTCVDLNLAATRQYFDVGNTAAQIPVWTSAKDVKAGVSVSSQFVKAGYEYPVERFAVKTFIAPYNGVVNVSGIVKEYREGANGNLKILKNNVQIWPAPGSYDGTKDGLNVTTWPDIKDTYPIRYTEELDLSLQQELQGIKVKKNDRLQFVVVNGRRNTPADEEKKWQYTRTQLDPTITYASGEGMWFDKDRGVIAVKDGENTVFKATVGAPFEKSGACLLAGKFEDNLLKNIYMSEDVQLAPGQENVLSVSVPSEAAKTGVSLFFWNGIGRMSPIAERLDTPGVDTADLTSHSSDAAWSLEASTNGNWSWKAIALDSNNKTFTLQSMDAIKSYSNFNQDQTGAADTWSRSDATTDGRGVAVGQFFMRAGFDNQANLAHAAVKEFTAPKDGKVLICGKAETAVNVANGDKPCANIKIMKNRGKTDEKLVFPEVGSYTPEMMEEEVTNKAKVFELVDTYKLTAVNPSCDFDKMGIVVDVKADDTLTFEVYNGRRNADKDKPWRSSKVTWDPVVTYVKGL